MVVYWISMKKPSNKKPCSITRVAGLLSDTWTILIINTLLSSKHTRFCELERTLFGISTRTLTLKLKTLEDEGIVLKTECGYIITALGRKLRPILKAMEHFGKQL